MRSRVLCRDFLSRVRATYPNEGAPETLHRVRQVIRALPIITRWMHRWGRCGFATATQSNIFLRGPVQRLRSFVNPERRNCSRCVVRSPSDWVYQHVYHFLVSATRASAYGKREAGAYGDTHGDKSPELKIIWKRDVDMAPPVSLFVNEICPP